VVRFPRPFRRGRIETNRGIAVSDDEGNPLVGWLIFILIFGVGNMILYATTGAFIIPLPRR
jgi:hypothetical protein